MGLEKNVQNEGAFCSCSKRRRKLKKSSFRGKDFLLVKENDGNKRRHTHGTIFFSYSTKMENSENLHTERVLFFS